MNCPECGKEIPENCNSCPDCATPEQEPAKKKKKTALIVIISVAACLLIAAAAVLAITLTKDDSPSGTSSSDVSAPNPAYEKIFKDKKITETTPDFDSKHISEFVMVTDKGNVEKFAFGHNGNRVEYMSNYIYIDIKDFGEEEIKAVDEFCRTEYAKFAEKDFGKVIYDDSPSGSFYEVRIEFSDLDKAANVRQLQQWGFVQGGLAWFISVDSTEQGLTQKGFIKK